MIFGAQNTFQFSTGGFRKASPQKRGGRRGHPNRLTNTVSGGHGDDFVHGRANHIRDLHLGSAV